MKLGTASSVMPVEPGLVLEGYADRNGKAIGSHDELYASVALLTEDDAELHFLVSLDILNLPLAFVQDVQDSLATWFHPAQVIVQLCASHTHAGPSLHPEHQENAGFVSRLKAVIGATCLRAYANLRETYKMARWDGKIDEFGAVRRQGKPISLPLTVIGFYDVQDSPLPNLLVFHLPCHPTILGADNLHFSAEWPGAAVYQLHNLLGCRTQVMFLNGAAGDISTRQTRREQTFREVERFGAKVAQVTCACLQEQPNQITLQPRITSQQKTVQLERQSAFSIAQNEVKTVKQQNVDARTLHTFNQALTLREKVFEAVPQCVDVTLSVWSLSDVLQLVFWPGEPFSSFAKSIDLFADIPTILVGYCGEIGYLPDVTPAEDPSYEVFMSPYGRDGADLLLLHTQDLIHNVARSS